MKGGEGDEARMDYVEGNRDGVSRGGGAVPWCSKARDANVVVAPSGRLMPKRRDWVSLANVCWRYDEWMRDHHLVNMMHEARSAAHLQLPSA